MLNPAAPPAQHAEALGKGPLRVLRCRQTHSVRFAGRVVHIAPATRAARAAQDLLQVLRRLPSLLTVSLRTLRRKAAALAQLLQLQPQALARVLRKVMGLLMLCSLDSNN
jgi:hypothetical protein